MTTQPAQTIPINTPLFVRYMRDERYLAWRRIVEGLITATGVRPALIHLGEGNWAQHFGANEDAFNAVVAELNGVDG